MDSRIEQAVELFKQGYSCSQAIFVTYADRFGVDRLVAAKVSAPFGHGMGGLRQVCGTVTAMSMLAGMYNGMTAPGDREAKKANFEMVKMLSAKFQDEHGSIRCGQLLGQEPGLPEGYVRKPCTEYVRTCARLVEQHLLSDVETGE